MVVKFKVGSNELQGEVISTKDVYFGMNEGYRLCYKIQTTNRKLPYLIPVVDCVEVM